MLAHGRANVVAMLDDIDLGWNVEEPIQLIAVLPHINQRGQLRFLFSVQLQENNSILYPLGFKTRLVGQD